MGHAKDREGVSPFNSGMHGNISETARSHSRQWVQVPGGLAFAAAPPWQGNDAISSAPAASVGAMAAGIPDNPDEVATPCTPENGMTAAMAPDSGSHAIIQTNTSLRSKIICM